MKKVGTIEIYGFEFVQPDRGSGKVSFCASIAGLLGTVTILVPNGRESDYRQMLAERMKTQPDFTDTLNDEED